MTNKFQKGDLVRLAETYAPNSYELYGIVLGTATFNSNTIFVKWLNGENCTHFAGSLQLIAGVNGK